MLENHIYCKLLWLYKQGGGTREGFKAMVDFNELVTDHLPTLAVTVDRAWLSYHPEKDAEWLARMKKEGFHIHHLDGDHSNDAKGNLLLIYRVDHYKLHVRNVGVRTAKRAWAKPPKQYPFYSRRRTGTPR